MSLILVRRLALLGSALLTATLALGAGGAGATRSFVAYNLYPLISDGSAVAAPLADTSLVNGWGLTSTATSPWWTANNKTNSSTLYTGGGAKNALTVTVSGGPTGAVANGNTADFAVSQGGGAASSARFLFDTQSGQVLGWAPSVNANTAVVAVDSSAEGAVYDGLATANDRLYAADFHNARVAVFDASFAPLSLGFTDPKIPKGWAPFGIAALNGNIFVTYAQQNSARNEPVVGGGLGYVDEFTLDGQLVARVASKGTARAPLNAPWGLALAPANFGAYSGDLLVGNFGNGRISAYQQTAGKWVYKGQIRTASGTPIAIDGLWGLAFGNGASAGPTNNLYFLAGPTGQTHGLFGFIAVG
jgi:uncharacterized protein (TIGR03118 family)